MARRPILGEAPKSRLAVWSSRLAWFALFAALLSLLIVRTGLLETVPTLVTFVGALACAGLAVLFAIAAFIVIWRDGLTGVGRAVTGLLLGTAMLAYPAYLGYRATRLPAIHDITTDTMNPPRFEVLARLRPRGSSEYPGAQVAAMQRAAYPDIVPLQVELPVKQTYDIALKIIGKRKWLVVDARPPGFGRTEAVIELVARTTVMGFRQDMVIRISPMGAGARVDVRSASRYGFHDFGDNARRIRALLDNIEEEASSAPEPRVEPEKPEPKRPQRRQQQERRQPANR